MEWEWLSSYNSANKTIVSSFAFSLTLFLYSFLNFFKDSYIVDMPIYPCLSHVHRRVAPNYVFIAWSHIVFQTCKSCVWRWWVWRSACLSFSKITVLSSVYFKATICCCESLAHENEVGKVTKRRKSHRDFDKL
jgi:hypothetical protein